MDGRRFCAHSTLAALFFAFAWCAVPSANAQSQSNGGELDRRRPKKLAFPPQISGTITFTQKTTSDPNHTLTITWSGFLELDEQLNELKGPFVAGYGLGHGSFRASGGSSSAGG